MLRTIQNIRICMGKKKLIVSVTYENERISIKNSLTYLKCVLHLSCVVHGLNYGRFMGFYVKGFSLQLSLYKPFTEKPIKPPPLLVNVQPWKYILAQTLLNYASFLKMVELNNVCFCVGAGYCSSPCSLRVQV